MFLDKFCRRFDRASDGEAPGKHPEEGHPPEAEALYELTPASSTQGSTSGPLNLDRQVGWFDWILVQLPDGALDGGGLERRQYLFEGRLP